MVFVKISSVLGVIAATSAVVNAVPQNYGGSYGSASSVDATSTFSAQSSYQTSSGYGSSSSGYGSSSSGYGSSSGGSSCDSGDCSGSSSGSSSSNSCDSGDCSGSSSSSCDSGDCSGSSSSSSDCQYGDCSDSSTVLATSVSQYYTSSVDSTDLATSTSVSQYYTSSVDSTDLSTSTALATSVSMPSYGSGYSSWDSSGYDSCVQQCIASYGTPGTYYPPTTTSGSSGSTGTGSAMTIIVAPTPGVFRYFPFATNASVGQTVQWQWGANNHTVTKSSELTLCNKTNDNPFASGEQNTSFVFNQQINDTNPIFFYCGTPTHCEKGMFGVINPPSNFGAPTSVGSMMSAVIQNDTTGNLGTYYNYTVNMTANSAAASSWGNDIDMAGMDSSAYSFVVENVLFTRNVMAMNPDIIDTDGSINLDAVSSGNPLMVPNDVGSALAAADSVSSSSSAPASSASSTGSSSSSSSASPSSTSASSNGAISMTSSKVLVGAMAVVATFFAL